MLERTIDVYAKGVMWASYSKELGDNITLMTDGDNQFGHFGYLMQIDCHCQQPSQGLMRGCEFEPKCQHFDWYHESCLTAKQKKRTKRNKKTMWICHLCVTL